MVPERGQDMDALEEQEQWDFEKAERKPAVKAPRMVVSVSFSRPDFVRVTEHAEHIGMKTSEFIREAALKEVKRSAEVVNFAWTGFSEGAVVVREALGVPTHAAASTADTGVSVYTG